MAKLPVIDSGHVARCTAFDCDFNRSGTCDAPNGVQILFQHGHADCATYTRKGHRVE